MSYREILGDILDSNSTNIINTIGMDIEMNNGLARLIDTRYPMVKNIINTAKAESGTWRIPFIAVVSTSYDTTDLTNDTNRVFINFITKNDSNRPTDIEGFKRDFTSGINLLKKYIMKQHNLDIMSNHEIFKEVSMPLIGHDVYGLDWTNFVKPLIKRLSTDTGVNIKVYFNDNNRHLMENGV